MRELMIHVERIVRPVRATQSRKLRMRRELSAHLQSALDEERLEAPDEADALQRAKHRLGDPSDLTQQLQRSVPAFERIMLAQVPTSQEFDRHEQQAARVMYGPAMRGMTMGHISILCAFIGQMTATPAYSANSVRACLTGTQPAHITMFFMTALVGVNVMLLVCSRFVFALAQDDERVNWRVVSGLAGLVLAMQLAFLVCLEYAASDRLPTAVDVLRTTAIALAAMAVSAAAARWVARRRRSYDEWLLLDLNP